jgi:hypothetical protein
MVLYNFATVSDHILMMSYFVSQIIYLCKYENLLNDKNSADLQVCWISFKIPPGVYPE